jgi:hypothetical protein
VLALEVQTPTCGGLLSGRRRAAGWPHDLASRGASRHESRGTPVAVDVAQAEAGVSAEQARDAIRRYSGRRTSTSARATDSTAPTMAVSITLPPAYVLWATLKLTDVDKIPAQTTVVRFALRDRPTAGYWLILRRPQPELCTRPGGYAEDIVCRPTRRH